MGNLHFNLPSVTLTELRENAKLSRIELADKLGISENSVGRYERGERTPPARLLAEYAKELKVPVEYLVSVIDVGVNK